MIADLIKQLESLEKYQPHNEAASYLMALIALTIVEQKIKYSVNLNRHLLLDNNKFVESFLKDIQIIEEKHFMEIRTWLLGNYLTEELNKMYSSPSDDS